MTGTTGHVMRAIAATGAILAAETVPGSASDWISMVERLGLAIALVVFFVWTGWLREKRMAVRIDFLDKALSDATKKISALTERVNTTLDEENATMRRALEVLDGRTCLAFNNHEEFREFQRWKESRREGGENTPMRGIVQQG